jgi:hypothetical protein
MVSSDAQNDAQSDAQSPAEKAHEYQQSVLQYEALDKQIDDLLQSRGGVSENLSDEDFAHYRELADLRDLAYNRMKTLERALLDE